MTEEQTLVERIRTRAEIRLRIRSEGDRIAKDLNDAANRIEELEEQLRMFRSALLETEEWKAAGIQGKLS